MSKSTLYCIACVVMLIGTVSPVLAFTVSISNYSSVYSGWEESWYPDENGNWCYWYWSGTATDRIGEDPYGWGTNRRNILTCQINANSSATITNSGVSVPSANYLWLNGYGLHVCGSFVSFYQFDFDLAWTGMYLHGPWYLCVLNQSMSYIGNDITKCTSYWTKRLSSSGSYHVTGNLNGSGVPIVVLANVPPGTTVPEPLSLIGLLGGIAGVVGSAIRRSRHLDCRKQFDSPPVSVQGGECLQQIQ